MIVPQGVEAERVEAARFAANTAASTAANRPPPRLPFTLSPRLSVTLVSVVALLGGVVASAGFDWRSQTVLLIAVAALLSQGSWLVLWNAIAGTDWATPWAEWKQWRTGPPITTLPHAPPGSDAAKTAAALGQLRTWVQQRLWPAYGARLSSLVTALVLAAVLPAVLGSQAVLLTLFAVILPQVALYLGRGEGRPNSVLQGLVQITLPMVLGYSLFEPLFVIAGWDVVAAAIGLGVAFGGVLTQRPRHLALHVGQGLVLLVMVITRRPVGAFLIALFWMPHLLRFKFITRDSTWWLIASTVAACAALS